MKTYFFIKPQRIIIIRMIGGTPVIKEFKANIDMPPDEITAINGEQLANLLSEEFNHPEETKEKWTARWKRFLNGALVFIKDLFIATFSQMIF